ncbi:MAG: glutamate 5-kinase [Coriobacteriales bacterium]|jgi:glutamate 5-kinase|nr:glutamate 5-kinase [Coriobacteriales bacterium]
MGDIAERDNSCSSNNNSNKRIVLKIGTSTLTDDNGKVDEAYITRLASQVAEIRRQAAQVLIVSSGAISAGLEALGLPAERPDSIPTLQAAAAVGQLALAKVYSSAFAAEDLTIGQVLLTRFDTTNRNSYLHVRDTLERLLELGSVPLINENDTVAVEEIRFGDNDTLAALVAILVKADLVILLSDIDGLYTADPRLEQDARLLESIGALTEELEAGAGAAGSVRGSGGMVTKLEAARICMAANIPMVICQGRDEGAIAQAIAGKPVGTLFSREGQHRQASAKKLWLALSDSVKGYVTVDDGAARALQERGSSLLPVGVSGVHGDFSAGQAIDIRNSHGFLIARGISGYSAAELHLAAGLKSGEVASNDQLAHLADTEVVHRDQLLVF